MVAARKVSLSKPAITGMYMQRTEFWQGCVFWISSGQTILADFSSFLHFRQKIDICIGGQIDLACEYIR
jgi:hypothetical protein